MRTTTSMFEMMRLSTQTGMMIAEAQWIVAMRLWGMAGAWNVTPGENRRMVAEKGPAMLASAMAAQSAMLRGASPAETMLAAVKPVRRKTRANARRLTKRGPRHP